jgi:preprotein translocase subunit SecA
MEVLERIWEIVGLVFGGLARSFERSLTSLFGSSNARYIRRLQAKVQAINALEPKFQAMSDDQLRGMTVEFSRRFDQGETLDDLLVEAFAVCREGGRRFIGLRHYDVQLIGGMVLHSGNIAEMVTGEGKTLVATLPAYLNAVADRGVHVITVNDYLARRDMEWMGPLYMGLGLTVGAIYSGMDNQAKQQAYTCDITYGTNNEFGFDYLRDNMKRAANGDDRYPKSDQQVQRPLYYAIIDEVDNILIDEARTPLIISGPAYDDVGRYAKADEIARKLKKDIHFEVKEKEHSVHMTDEGVREAERQAGVESFYTAGNMDWPHLLDNALKAHFLYKRDVNYVIDDGEVIIVDEFTGRKMPGRQWSDGLHQSVEAKEGVRIKEETQTYATITLQNYFKLYKKISGMTGTAMTEASEFWKIYKLDVVAIPTNRSLTRLNHPDVIYRTEREKYTAIIEEIERLHRWDTVRTKDEKHWVGELVQEGDNVVAVKVHDTKKVEELPRDKVVAIERAGRPILVGTVSIEKSERLSSMLDKVGIKHQVLNAKYHQREAEIIAQAGRKGAVTIATNMAGRGTDIILGGNPDTMAWALLQDKYATRLDVPKEEWAKLVREIEEREKMKTEGAEVKQLGGLHVIGSERHEARRIDLQLRGRCGRQGDPGSSRFFLSLEDDLMRIFAGEWVKNVLTRLGMQDGEAIESKMVSRRIEGAQKKVEERHFESRKNLLEYDEVMDEQRKRVYGFRQGVLDGVNCKTRILSMIEEQINRHLDDFLDKDYGASSFANWAGHELGVELDPRDYRGLDSATAERTAKDEAQRQAEGQVLDAIEESLPEGVDPSEWNWESMARFANVRWKLSLRDRDLKQAGRDQLGELLITQARESLEKIDLSGGAPLLDVDYGLRTTAAWVHYKFNLELPWEELRNLEPPAIKELVLAKAEKAYDEKEVEYPVMAGMARFSAADSSGQKRFDRDQLVAWARDRFEVEFDTDDLRNKQRDEVREVLLAHSRSAQDRANQSLVEVQQQVAKLFPLAADGSVPGHAAGNGALTSLSAWLHEKLACDLPAETLARLDREQLEQRLQTAVEDRYRPEIRRMERAVMLQLLDTAWKDHLLAMDHLRSSVGLRGYAQVDPKVEYKREGMRIFETMWTAVGERVTDMIFRLEQLDENFVSSTWVESHASHAAPPPGLGSDSDQAQAIDGSDQPVKSEPIRNRGEQVGRNDPCPCGSGKKYKNCCMKRDGGSRSVA